MLINEKYHQFTGSTKVWGVAILFMFGGFLLGAIWPIVILQSGISAQAQISILRILGGVFGAIGLAIFILKIFKVRDEIIDQSGGLIGLAIFAIPSLFFLPIMSWMFENRPNFLYPKDVSIFPDEHFPLGLLFSLLGLICTIILIYLIKRTVENAKNHSS